MFSSCRWALLATLAAMTMSASLWTAQAGGQGTKYALLVGCADYDKTQLRPLPYTVADVEGFEKALRATGYEADHIVMLHDKMPQTRYRPHRNNILKELRLLLEGMRSPDMVVVALSGHGLHFKGDKTGYFCPVDARIDDKSTLIAMDGKDSLFEILKACRAKQKLLIVNACRNDPTTDLALAAQKIQIDDEDADEVPDGIAAIYSCRQGQKSYYDPDRKLSLFYDHLIRAWKGEYHKSSEKLKLEHVLDHVVLKTKVDANKTLGALQVPEVRREYKGEWVVNEAGLVDPFQVATEWQGNLTQRGKSPGIENLAPHFDAALVVIKRNKNAFEAELRLNAGGATVTYLLKGSVSLPTTDGAFGVNFNTVGVKNKSESFVTNRTQVPYAGEIREKKLTGTWKYPPNNDGITIEGDFDLQLK